MRKLLALLAVLCVLLLPMSAMAQTTGNLNNTGFIETDGTSLFIAKADGLWRVDDGAAAKISDDRADSLQWYESRLYYVANAYEADESGDMQFSSQTLKSCLADGRDVRILGEVRPLGANTEYPEAQGGVTLVDTFVGYRCFTVADGAIFFLGNDGEGGEYVCKAQAEDAPIESKAQFTSGIALYRMGLEGGTPTKLTGTLGNSVAQMAVSDGKIYVGAGYADVNYAYNFVNYAIYDEDGNVLSAFENNDPTAEDAAYFSDIGAFYHIPDAVTPDGENMLVSLCDSEGDFISSTLTRLKPDGTTEPVAIQFRYIHGIVEENRLYYLASASEGTFFDDTLDYNASTGIYARAVSDGGTGEKLVALPYNGFINGMELSVLGNFVYFKGSDGSVYRTPKQGGGVLETLTDNGFAACSEINYTEAS